MISNARRHHCQQCHLKTKRIRKIKSFLHPRPIFFSLQIFTKHVQLSLLKNTTVERLIIIRATGIIKKYYEWKTACHTYNTPLGNIEKDPSPFISVLWIKELALSENTCYGTEEKRLNKINNRKYRKTR